MISSSKEWTRKWTHGQDIAKGRAALGMTDDATPSLVSKRAFPGASLRASVTPDASSSGSLSE